LRELEDALAQRSDPAPSTDFRARMLGAMSRTPARRGADWRRLGQAAALIVLALNLAMGVANGIRFERLSAIALAQQDMPSLPAADERLPPFSAAALANLVPTADVSVLGERCFAQ
jgi:hypothetical protein